MKRQLSIDLCVQEPQNTDLYIQAPQNTDADILQIKKEV